MNVIIRRREKAIILTESFTADRSGAAASCVCLCWIAALSNRRHDDEARAIALKSIISNFDNALKWFRNTNNIFYANYVSKTASEVRCELRKIAFFSGIITVGGKKEKREFTTHENEANVIGFFDGAEIFFMAISLCETWLFKVWCLFFFENLMR